MIIMFNTMPGPSATWPRLCIKGDAGSISVFMHSIVWHFTLVTLELQTNFAKIEIHKRAFSWFYIKDTMLNVH